MRSFAVVAPRSRAFGFVTSTGRSPSGSGERDRARDGQRAGARLAARDRHAGPGTMRTPLPPPAEPVVSRRIAEFLSGDRQFRLADAEGQPYSHPWRNAPSGGSGRLDTNPVTPLKSHRHHPLSDIARIPPDVGSCSEAR